MKNKKHNLNNGITLVALVITIIVLLILAGVAINMAINSNGLFGKVNAAADKWNTAFKEESNTIWNLLNIGDNSEKLQKGDVKLSYNITDTDTGKQINLKIDIVDVPEIDYSSKMYDNFVKNEFLAGKTVEQLLVLGGEILYPGVGLTEEQVYDGVLKDELGKTYTEFMANPDGIIKEKYGYDTAEEYAKVYILQGLSEELMNSYAAEIMYSKELLPELVGKEEGEIKSIIENYVNNEATFEQILLELFGLSTLDEVLAYINGELGITSEAGYVISKEQVLIGIAAKLYTVTSSIGIDVTLDNTSDVIDWYGKKTIISTYYITKSGEYTFTIFAPSGKIQERIIKISSMTEHVKEYVIEGTRKAPIPVGYVASQIPTEDTISEGLVIYEGTDTVTGEANSTAHITAMTNRNQFVWIPVDDINYMVMCKSNSSTSVCNLAIQTDGTLKCEKHNSTDLCGRIYEKATSQITVNGDSVFKASQKFTEEQWLTQTYDVNSGYREPDIASDFDEYDTDSTIYLSLAGITSGKVTDFKTQLIIDFKAMATSVAKYGGFYVSRYEAGEKGASLKNQKALVGGSNTYEGFNIDAFISGNTWYGMYNTLRNSTAINKTAVNSHMIWGSQYDMMIKYLEENSKNEPQVGHAVRQLATQKLTGETTKDIMSNIYDLEGNNFEWTAEVFNTRSRIVRGGDFYCVTYDKAFCPAFERFESDPRSLGCCGASRSVLYVK